MHVCTTIHHGSGTVRIPGMRMHGGTGVVLYATGNRELPELDTPASGDTGSVLKHGSSSGMALNINGVFLGYLSFFIA